MLFWTCYVGGTFGPIVGSLLMSRLARPLDDFWFLLSWLLWLFGTGLLIACGWSVRTILWAGAREIRRPAWLYRTFGWVALAESLVWAWTCVRAI
jgi:hypothetical protein